MSYQNDFFNRDVHYPMQFFSTFLK